MMGFRRRAVRREGDGVGVVVTAVRELHHANVLRQLFAGFSLVRAARVAAWGS
ncbi:hypothetical protein GTY87_23680 [Streptomyces sp. SID7813]|uniref:Uncharacterized protein n=1 Tax=Streptomyces coelicolor (strain ATCC BAA-471 / A3(2) / M145) TaxID=100226 RepID=Q9F2T9_STRCO|nr:hypothetical protein [Streptomyces sp. SID7813]QFI44559.1 hypothetical protein FQ762_23895 [Streptomyces coelicolor A3(2)]CAC08276.1 hypothetical protein SCD39.23 [Streptomyces coelicolor A3(2)]